MSRWAVLREVWEERDRQEALKASGRYPRICSDVEMSEYETAVVLVEEVLEAALAVLHAVQRHAGLPAHDGGNTRKELVQAAAVSVGWVEKLDKLAAAGAGPIPSHDDEPPNRR